jgi:hypothetical protein
MCNEAPSFRPDSRTFSTVIHDERAWLQRLSAYAVLLCLRRLELEMISAISLNFRFINLRPYVKFTPGSSTLDNSAGRCKL